MTYDNNEPIASIEKTVEELKKKIEEIKDSCNKPLTRI